MKKNDVIKVEILDNGMDFEGIARYDNKVIFIPNSIIGENIDIRIVKDNKNFAFGKIENINVSSVYRTEPICNISNVCGGCETQHIEYGFGLNLKTKIVKNALDKQKIQYEKISNCIGMGRPYYYRNKVSYPVRNINGIDKIGFYKQRTHIIAENNCCYIQDRIIDMLAKIIFEKLIDYNFKMYNENDFSGDIKHIILRRGYHTSEIMIVIVLSNKLLLKDTRFNNLIQELDKDNIKGIFLNVNENNTNEILGKDTKRIYGEDYITETIGKYSFYISPKSFFQVNTVQTEMLYHVLEKELKLNKDDILFDLYSGVGTIGIFLSDKVNKVYGIEIEEEAVKMANLNIQRNNISNCEYIAGSVEDKIEEFAKRKIKPSVIVVDPPRKGLDEKSIQYILDFRPEKIGYVSCNVATLARDLKVLSEKYDIKSVTPVDMFPQTVHVECVVILEKK